MKFARYLDEQVVPEWKKVYIQYRGLKKLIKRVAEHRQLRLQYENPPELGRSLSGSTAVNNDHVRRPDLATIRRRTGTNHQDETTASLATSPGYLRRTDYGGTSQPQPQQQQQQQQQEPNTSQHVTPHIPPVSLDGTGLHLSFDSPFYSGTPPPQSHRNLDQHPDLEAQTHPAHPSTHVDEQDIAQAPSSPFERQQSHQQDHAPQPLTTQPPSNEPTSSSSSPTAIRYQHDPARKSPPKSKPTMHSKRTNSSSAGSRRLLLSKSGSFGRVSNRSNKFQFPTSLDEIIRTQFDQEEAKFFSACDNELERIIAFYEARELDAVHKYGLLVRQLQELAEHRREYRAKYGIRDSDKTLVGSTRNRLSQMLSHVPGASKLDEGLPIKALPSLSAFKLDSRKEKVSQQNGTNGKLKQQQPEQNTLAKPSSENEEETMDAGDRRRAQALAQMQDSLKGWDDETDKAIRAANKAAAMSHDPEAYAAARKKLKAAVLEYYKFLETLSNYRILNRTGFAKVMKKFSKSVGVPCADAYYEAKVAPSVLVTSDRVERLIKATEEIYTAYFEHGNRKQALNRLRVREEHSTHHFSVFRSGFWLGISLCATIAGLVEAMNPQTQREIPQWQGLLRVYGAEFIPTMFALLFGLNLAWWHRVRINTVFIFEWDVRTTMDHRQFFELPALFMLILSIFFWISFSNPFPTSIAPTTWPTVWLVVVAVIMLNPFPIFLRDSRAWFAKSLVRVFTAGYKRVEFRDFFIGDELNSVAWSISNFWYFGCEYHNKWSYPDRCAPNSTYWTAVLLSIPAVLRLGQCIRRWKDSDYRTHLHMVNAGKYSSAILNNFFYIHYRKNGSHGGGDMALWIVFACIYSIWHISWDLIMDWSLLKPRAKYWLLRNELAFPVYVYYVFIIADVVGRSIWIIYLIPGSASITLRSFLAALIEMIRRVCWNNLRVENEQIGNTDSFKIIRDLPLPYRQKVKDGDDADQKDGNGGGGLHREGIFASVKLATLGKKKTEPLTAASVTSSPADEIMGHDGVGFGSPDRSLRPNLAHRSTTGHYSGSAVRNLASRSSSVRGPGVGEEEEDKATSASVGGPSLVDRLRNKLVPESQDSPSYTKRLDERGATKGDSGRDYSPRAAETLDGGDSDDDSELDDSTAANHCDDGVADGEPDPTGKHHQA